MSEHRATVGYDSVRRFVQQLGASSARGGLPMRRMECAAGEEVQVDFGTGAPLVLADGKKRKTSVFRMVLSHSRKGYCESSLGTAYGSLGKRCATGAPAARNCSLRWCR